MCKNLYLLNSSVSKFISKCAHGNLDKNKLILPQFFCILFAHNVFNLVNKKLQNEADNILQNTHLFIMKYNLSGLIDACKVLRNFLTHVCIRKPVISCVTTKLVLSLTQSSKRIFILEFLMML